MTGRRRVGGYFVTAGDILFAVPFAGTIGQFYLAGLRIPDEGLVEQDEHPTMSQPPRIRILSAGAPKTGVRLCAEAYRAATGTPFDVEFATAPKIRERVAAGTANADVIVAPATTLEEFAADGAVAAGSGVELGSISAGVAVRNGALEPDMTSVEAFRQALLAADALIYNRASSGQYIEKMIKGLGIAEAVAEKTVRTDSGAGVMERLARDRSERTIGFGQITEIRLHEDLGIHLAGSLPGVLGKTTSYSAGIFGTAANADAAQGLLALFAAEEGRRLLRQTGVE